MSIYVTRLLCEVGSSSIRIQRPLRVFRQGIIGVAPVPVELKDPEVAIVSQHIRYSLGLGNLLKRGFNFTFFGLDLRMLRGPRHMSQAQVVNLSLMSLLGKYQSRRGRPGSKCK